MIELGYFSLLLALALSLFAAVAYFLAAKTSDPVLSRGARRAVESVWFTVTVSSACLMFLLAGSDFSLKYVTDYTNRDLPIFYKLAAFWAGQSGSLLFWSWLLSVASTILAWQNRKTDHPLSLYAMTWMMITTAFFLILNLFASNPFERLGVVQADGRIAAITPPDGQGLNPLLQYFAMVIHPPVLFIGYVGFTVPFAFAMSALWCRQTDDLWWRLSRRWTLISWGFLGAGILLGAQWAYMELGWGGYWAWDPVENASLLPWLTGTALLHAVMVQERRGMLRRWNLILAIATFLLCIFGTFLTRSGVVSSVHAFGKSNLGTFFLVFMIVVLSLAVVLLLLSRSDRYREFTFQSLTSRESSIVYNSLVLVVSCLTVLIGTMMPVFSELLRGEQITVGPPFFNKVHIPIALILLLLTGVCPFLTWKRTSGPLLLRNLFWPVLLAAIGCIGLVLGGIRHGTALLFWSLCLFVAVALLMEYLRGIRARRKAAGENPVQALFSLTSRNTRRYGGYVVHLGSILIFAGLTGAWFNQEAEKELAPGESMKIGAYELRCRELRQGDTKNYSFVSAGMDVLRDSRPLTGLEPQRRMYKAGRQVSTEVALYPTWKEDLYVVYKGQSSDGRRAVIQAFVNPLVNWLWIGGLVMMLGTAICLLPNRRGTILPANPAGKKGEMG